jgi:hypothetical protein
LGYLYFAGTPMVDVGDQFMTALKAGELQTAFALCAPGYQAQLGSADSLPGQIGLMDSRQPVSWTLDSYQSRLNDQAILSGSVTFSDGSPGTAQITMQNLNGQWMITNVQIT